MLPGLPATALPPGLATAGATPPAEPGGASPAGQAFSRLLGRLREPGPLAPAPTAKPDAAEPAADATDPRSAALPLATAEDTDTLPADVLAAMLAAPIPPAVDLPPAELPVADLPVAPTGLPADAAATVLVGATPPPLPATAPSTTGSGDAAAAGIAAATTLRAASTLPARSTLFERGDAPRAEARAPAGAAEPGLAPMAPAAPAAPAGPAGPASPAAARDAAHAVREAVHAALAPPGPQLPAQALAVGLRSAEGRTAGQEPAQRSAAAAGAADAAGAFAAMLSAVPGPQPTGPTAAAPALQITATLDAPEFAEQLGVQLSTLARDGVQRAELHLNPVEMGPVSVQIALDGTQARIEFGAEMAATRQAIEHSLPALASALRDAGLTLAGGAVSQHAAGQGGRQGAADQGEHRDGGRAHRDGSDAPLAHTAAATAARRLVRAGGVDLYA